MLAITQGDPAGIGPEVTLKGFTGVPRRLHIGDPEVYYRTAAHLGVTLPFQVVDSPEAAARLSDEQFAILPTTHRAALFAEPSRALPFGEPHAAHAAVTMESIITGCRLAMEKRVLAVVTPPINKAVLHSGGFSVPGHTEILAQCAGVATPVMMLATEGLRVVPVTIHQSLRSVADTLTADLLRRTIEITYAALQRDFAIAQPRLAVTGLNPHAGEEGAFGREEVEKIAPVCQALAELWPGAIRGPLAADSLFHPEARQTYDAVICMYHDQALIPLKMLGFGRSVNITLGLPIVRTSVDHGTAYPIAGQGIADPRSFQQAVLLAVELAANRRRSTLLQP
ncbi:MAG: 4-hydroxythreonine-4-phosphate dehydrogenase PdxA [Magnetococcales bacterium]|nr:4-hydroxythreonine-4-phosphate dehydrogenase PdxA [Magnetococcales bacterium]